MDRLSNELVPNPLQLVFKQIALLIIRLDLIKEWVSSEITTHGIHSVDNRQTSESNELVPRKRDLKSENN